MKKDPLNPEEIKKEHPEMYISAKVWDIQREKERKRLYDLSKKIKEEIKYDKKQ